MKSKLTAVTLTLFGALGLIVSTASARPDPAAIGSHGDGLGADNPAGPRPGTAPDGSYVALNESMRAGQVMTINPDSVYSYGKPRVVRFEGRHYWQIPVVYRHRTYGNGQIISEGRALVRNGMVEHWVFHKSSIRIP